MKRLFDVFASALILLVSLPVMAVITILVKRSSPGPALFIQKRVGRFEELFDCYKFRTMTADAPVAGSHEVSQSWITPLGRRLRSSKLDELPQLLNVLKGDMSLVGPRPCLPSQQEVIRERRRLDVFAVRPGITGLAQLAGVDMSVPASLAEMDAEYAQNKNFILDMRLLLATALGKGSGDAVSGN